MKIKRILAAACAVVLCASATGLDVFAGEALNGIIAMTASAEGGIEISAENFPDDNFRDYVLEEIDTDGDGFLSNEEIKNTTEINCDYEDISSLQGIEYFTELTDLYCDYNKLTTLDVSGCTELTILDCRGNDLTELDVSGCAALYFLWCDENQLANLDISKNTLLRFLSCYDNQMTGLDISNNTYLIQAYFGTNIEQWTEEGYYFDSYFYGFEGDDDWYYHGYSYIHGLQIDKGIDVEIGNDIIVINEINFPDDNFRDYVLEEIDTDDDNILSAAEIDETTAIYCGYSDISSLKGIKYFTELTYLYCDSNDLTELDLSNNKKLTHLDCEDNQFTELDVNGCTALTFLDSSFNQLTKLDVSNNTALTYLDCSDNQLTELDVSGCAALTTLYCYDNQLTELDVSGCTALTIFYCNENQLTTLDLSGCTELYYLDCSFNQLTTLNVRGCTELEYLYCDNNQLTLLDISNNPNLILAYTEGEFEEPSYVEYTYECDPEVDGYYLYTLRIDPTTKVITDPNAVAQEVEVGTADVSGMQNNPNVDVTEMGVTFTDESGKTYSAQVQADGKIMLPALPAGKYTVTASLENCPSRDYDVTVESGEPVKIAVELKLYGDVNGDGKATTADLSKINENVQKTAPLSDYDSKVADVNGDGKVTTSDLSKINEHVQQSKLMW